MTIRRMRADDYAAYCALLCELHAAHRSARPDVYEAAPALPDEKAFSKMLEGEYCFVSEDEDGVTGMGVMRRRTYEAPAVKTRTVGWIEDLCVKETCRRRGAGRMLYRALIDCARAEGLSGVELNVWAFNAGARAFYERMGLTERSRVMEASIE